MTKRPCGAVQREALAVINRQKADMHSFPNEEASADRWRAPNAPSVRAIKIAVPELVARRMLPEAKRSGLSLKDVALRHILQSMGLTVEAVEAYSRAPKAPGEKTLGWRGRGGSKPRTPPDREVVS